MRYLVTGCYGFLGFHVCRELIAQGNEVIGADRLKGAHSKKGGRVELLAKQRNFSFVQADISTEDGVATLYRQAKPEIVIHLAAQYAVAPLTVELLQRYIDSVAGNVWMAWHANANKVKHYVYASSTFVEPGIDSTHAYGWSKAAAEKFAAVAASSNTPWHGMSVTGLRYGSTFGPWCRPDVGIYTLAKKLLNGQRIDIKPGSGFHYQTAFLDIRDAVGATLAAAEWRPTPSNDVLTVVADDERKDLGDILRMLEAATGKVADCDWSKHQPKEPGGIPAHAVLALQQCTGYRPKYSVEAAVQHFAAWAVEQHKAGQL